MPMNSAATNSAAPNAAMPRQMRAWTEYGLIWGCSIMASPRLLQPRRAQPVAQMCARLGNPGSLKQGFTFRPRGQLIGQFFELVGPVRPFALEGNGRDGSHRGWLGGGRPATADRIAPILIAGQPSRCSIYCQFTCTFRTLIHTSCRAVSVERRLTTLLGRPVFLCGQTSGFCEATPLGLPDREYSRRRCTGSLSFMCSNKRAAIAERGCTASLLGFTLSCRAPRSILSKAASQSPPNHDGCASKTSETAHNTGAINARSLPALSEIERRTSRRCNSPQSERSLCSVAAAQVSSATPPGRRREGGTTVIPNSAQMAATSDIALTEVPQRCAVRYGFESRNTITTPHP